MNYIQMCKDTIEYCNKGDFKTGDRFQEMLSYWVIILEKENDDSYLVFTGHPSHVQEANGQKYLAENVKRLTKQELKRLILGPQTYNKDIPSVTMTSHNKEWNDFLIYELNQITDWKQKLVLATSM